MHDFAENRLTKFSAGDAGDFSDAAGEREMAPNCGSLPRDAGDLVGLGSTDLHMDKLGYRPKNGSILRTLRIYRAILINQSF